MKKWILIIGFIIVLFGLVANGTASSMEAQIKDQWKYFPDTAHSVHGEFWLYYQSIPNAPEIFGSPITEAYTDPSIGRLIQYFQKVRFEYFPENPLGRRVVLTELGTLVFQKTKLENPVTQENPVGCRYFPDTGFNVCFAFLEYFDKNGGEPIFGKPISSFGFENGRIVQYFERGRLDYYPENPEGQSVVLAQLGRIYFDMSGEDPVRLDPVKMNNYPLFIDSIQAKSFTLKATTELNDKQELYVVVQDTHQNPVPGALVNITVSWADGVKQGLSATTNSKGVVVWPFLVVGQPHDTLVIVDCEVDYDGLLGYSQTSFRVWK